jgi:ubiquitin-like modifier-activating enzyme ATG7
MIESFETDSPILNSFLMFAFADLKKYSYHYRFAFPALVSKPGWQVEGSFGSAKREVRFTKCDPR